MAALAGASAPTVTSLFSRFDALELQQLVGSARARRMLTSESATFVMC